MSQDTPVRIALRYRERPFQDLKVVINAFFKWRGIQPLENYQLHICGNVDLGTLDIEIFKVSGCDPFRFVDLGEAARAKAYQRSLSIKWGG
ncbi:hypothetical protein IF1G_07519 [Cordyceps javanica]|uniref:Uncharacterized protein n=1 Tax=Cordyceps javanica TaxID=43265 RepID=A0A545UWE8_9HYPO|nr:hypothetical protein IF1G_07519 [Cordyceps javanica]TQW04567.1 hypothetical protein IF2G_07796 [Cordyceps javanica]